MYTNMAMYQSVVSGFREAAMNSNSSNYPWLEIEQRIYFKILWLPFCRYKDGYRDGYKNGEIIY